MEPHNPLPPCPRPGNCERESHAFETDADALFAAAQEALAAMDPVQVSLSAERRQVDAVFRVVFFKDDFTLRVEPEGGGSVLHLRSASRVGGNDFGVNKRRIERFLEQLSAALS